MVDNADRTVSGMQSFLGLYVAGIGAALCIALITAGIVYLVRPIVGRLIQWITLAQWAKRSSVSNIDIPNWLVAAAKAQGVPEVDYKKSRIIDDFREAANFSDGSYRQRIGLKTASSPLRDELFMHAVQLEAKAAIARPSSNPHLFMAVTAEAPADARGIAAFFDSIAREHPDIAAKMAAFEPQPLTDSKEAISAPSLNSTAAALQAAESVLLAASDRALDKLQLSLLENAIWPSRIVALGIGGYLALIGTMALGLTNTWLYIAVGIGGGILSLFISDTLAFLTRRIAR